MSYEIKGTIEEIFQIQVISDKFQKREFVLKTVEQVKDKEWNEQIKFQVTQDKCKYLDNFNEGEEVNVKFNIRGRKVESEKGIFYFNSLDVWNIQNVTESSQDNEMNQLEEKKYLPF